MMLFKFGLTKVRFVTHDFDSQKINEGIWCQRTGLSSFRIENLPFLTRGISYKDKVRCSYFRGEWSFLEVIHKSDYLNFFAFSNSADSMNIACSIFNDEKGVLCERVSLERCALAVLKTEQELLLGKLQSLASSGVRFERSNPI